MAAAAVAVAQDWRNASASVLVICKMERDKELLSTVTDGEVGCHTHRRGSSLQPDVQIIIIVINVFF